MIRNDFAVSEDLQDAFRSHAEGRSPRFKGNYVGPMKRVEQWGTEGGPGEGPDLPNAIQRYRLHI